ncbi:hypothetical protein TNCV_1805121 [Trichonephila clavipes]|nr:hypothetical protein TNCV_1805121 [Trichonephila clavipes]
MIRTSTYAPQGPMATFFGMGTVGPGPHGLLRYCQRELGRVRKRAEGPKRYSQSSLEYQTTNYFTPQRNLNSSASMAVNFRSERYYYICAKKSLMQEQGNDGCWQSGPRARVVICKGKCRLTSPRSGASPTKIIQEGD